MRNSILALILLLLAAGGCSKFITEEKDETKDWSAKELYTAAKKELDEKSYEKAINYYEILEARYPFGRYAQQAELEIAYAYYKYNEPDSAIAAADRFIKLHPRHENVDYAYYLKGLVNFNRGERFLDRIFKQDPSERDTQTARQAYNDFSTLVKEFPNSRYAKDASQRMIFLRNNLAQYEIHVADYYMRRKAYVAAANRGKYVVENYQGTPAVADALEVMYRAYTKLEMNDLAADARRVLQLNYPNRASKLDSK